MSENPSESTAIVIFGATGDLTRRKLLPALYELLVAERLPRDLAIVGFARRDWSDEYFREQMLTGLQEFARTKPLDQDALDCLTSRMHYLQSTFDQVDGYQRLAAWLKSQQVHNVLFYLATPPDAYVTITEHLGDLNAGQLLPGWSRIVVEKPYGQDLASALALDAVIHQVFAEDQVYRIDHYLGKETVQNILVFRLANGIFEPLWNRRYVDHVEITVAETVGVGTRAGYYEKSGVIRDMFQNHILQLLTLTAMEAPVAFNANAVRDEKVKILRALRPLRSEAVQANTLRAQYTAGSLNGRRVPAYKDESGVHPESLTETFLAARLFVDNWRWAGVPFYIRSGKRLPRRVTEVAVQFKQVPLSLFGWRNMAGDAPNVLVLNIQPDEGITLTFGAKTPGPINQIAPVKMHFDYEATYGSEPPEAYERLLLDSLMGDATLFTRSDEVTAAWAFTTDIIEGWLQHPLPRLPVYEAGTWGPASADDFIRRDGHSWRNMDG